MNTFLDEATIFVQGGDGGNGLMHFHREKYVSHGGPDGGDGGKGGDVYLQADRGLNTLFPFKRRRRFAAESGQTGGSSKMHGRNGHDLVVAVPVGTVVRNAEGEELLGDLTQNGQKLLVARGGQGGLGNVHFKSSTNQAPGFAEKGEPGQEQWLALELKLIADVGLIGLPNAGKSTLLSVISAARPKIAEYPFTTLTPNLGVVNVDDYSFVAADIPGLIEGAHEGVGLGHEFLRHIERTLLLVHVVDGATADPLSDFHQINDELRLHEAALAERPQVAAVNKMDLPAAQERWPELKDAFAAQNVEAMPISAATGEGVQALVYRVAQLVGELTPEPAESEERSEEVIIVPRRPDHFEIERKRGTFYVHGETAERLAVMTDLESEEALHRLQRRLKRMGLFRELEKAGVRDGATVRIGPVELVWDSSQTAEVKGKAGSRRR